MATDYPAPRAPLPPPPPPPPHAPAPGLLHAPQTPPLLRRIAVQPPLLTTALAPPQPAPFLHGSLHTPATASSLSLPFSPFVASSPATYAAPSIPASPMAARNPSSVPYNPQQWTRGGPVTGQHLQHAQTSVPSRLHDLTGMEGN